MSLSSLAIVLGLFVCALQVYALIKPAKFRDAARRFPRSEPWGYVLMLAGTAWFLWNLNQESISDFAAYKTVMLLGFGAIGVLACVFLRDFLAVRGLAIVMLLLAKVMVDTARWSDTNWRLVIVIWAYLMIFAGMWFTISPWRFRDLVQWATASELRIRCLGGVRLGFGLLLLVLGLTVFRSEPQGTQASAAPVELLALLGSDSPL